ncbi:hypothetical protein D1007_32818 [Hordeum vulgare]|nr:hypothetical protein D1007_32818 [Hordeum vulgare]
MPERAVTQAVINKPKDLPSIAFPAGRARASTIGVLSARASILRAGVAEYFIDGYRDGTLLKHKLMCSEPTSLAVLMAKADKYATADIAMRVKVIASDKAVPTPATPKPTGDNRGGQNNNKRKADQLDSRSNNKLVADMEGDATATSGRLPTEADQQE